MEDSFGVKHRAWLVGNPGSQNAGISPAVVCLLWLWLSDSRGLRGHPLPPSLLLHIHVDASVLTANV